VNKKYEGKNLRFITAWRNPKNIEKGVVIYTALKTADVIAINGIFHGPTDYSKPQYWMARPSSSNKKVDVFYLYPMLFQKLSTTEANICAIDNPVMLKFSKLAFERKAPAFEKIANIYAPYYQQADAAYCLMLPLDEQAKVLGGTPKSDILFITITSARMPKTGFKNLIYL